MNPLVQFITEALEASIFVTPTDHGLTFQELQQIGQVADIRAGELLAALEQAKQHAALFTVEQVSGRWRIAGWVNASVLYVPDLRPWGAFQLVTVVQGADFPASSFRESRRFWQQY